MLHRCGRESAGDGPLVTQQQDIAGQPLLEALSAIASQAAAAILAVRDVAATRRDKVDRSPVTAADDAAEAVILDALHRLMPDVPVVSEEAVGRGVAVTPGDHFFLVDPLDGTREFLAGLDEYTVNIALAQGGVPVIGVIAAPAKGLLWRGGSSLGAERLRLSPGDPPRAAREHIRIRARTKPAGAVRVLISRSHPDAATDAYVSRLPQAEIVRCGSSLKFCQLAEGSADLYPRLQSMSQWDIAAGHALLVAAGGAITALDGTAVRYGGTGSYRVPGFIACGDRSAVP